MKSARYQHAPSVRVQLLQACLFDLKDAREHALLGGAPFTYQKIQSAINSVRGAIRNAQSTHANSPTARVRRVTRPRRTGFGGVIHTSCRFCSLDIEGIAPYRRGEWRDRGNNTHCNDGKHTHAPERGTR